ncbi:GAF domain-containing protein [Nostoc sp. FACHB-190]|uniref:GAF domain-containing protein n=1 Tax=Nostoc sp. FACHB-190 TaxID=2692838 RepID=UPI001681D600|nr:GAF domain-containing protein [Nostoc sp. FACHB-190]MBD2301387.1 GAF domain-containing protein [Nostoc sp. FACHB-190]
MLNQTTSFTASELKSAIVPHPLIVTPATLVTEVINQMSGIRNICDATPRLGEQLDKVYLEARSSCVLVVEDGSLIGIFTERDVVRLSAEQHSLANLVIQEVMISPVVTLYESDLTDLFSAVNLLQQYHIRHIPILNEQEQVVGLLTHESLSYACRPVDLLRLRLVSEVMITEVITASADSSMLAIAQLLAKHRISSVMIVDTGGNEIQPLQFPLGIITERDIVQFQALGLNLKHCLAQIVMSSPVFTVKPHDSLLVVQQIMEQRFIRRLAVIGKQGELLGIVTQSNLLQALNPLELYKLAGILEKRVVQLEAEHLATLESHTVEREQQVDLQTSTLQAKISQENLIAEIAVQIRSSLSLQTILNTTVEKVRHLLGCDRVNIWQFHLDGQMTVVAESTNSTLSLVGEQIHDPCFSLHNTDSYRQGKIRVVSDIYTTPLSDCHRQMLIRLQTRAKILVPLLCGQQLWGLLNATESQHPREWQPEEIELLQMLSVHLAIALQQATTHQKLQDELRDRQRIELTLQKLVEGTAAVTGEEFFPALVSHIAEALNVSYVLVTEKLDNQLHTLGFWANGALQPPISYPMALTPCEYALNNGEFYCQNQVQAFFPDDLDLVNMQADSYLGIALKDNEGNSIGTLCILDLQPIQDNQYTEAIPILQVFAARAAAELQRKAANQALQRLNQDLEQKIAQRTQELQAREAQLRDFFDNATDLIQSIAPDGRILFVNRAWKEALGYDDSDLEQLSIFQVIHPDELVHCQTAMHSLFAGTLCLGIETRFLTKAGREIIVEGNVNCQWQNGLPIATQGIFRDITARKQTEKTIYLQIQREKLLREISQRIRESLDLQTIFNTACQEIRQVIQADRVGIFKFYPDSNFDDGEFVAESVGERFNSVVAIPIHDHCFGKNYSSLYAKGRFFAVDDIYKRGMSSCHSDILAEFQVRSNLVMPLLCGDELWGLLCIHQCGKTRSWRQSEIEFTQELSYQLAIAIQQANLYEKIQAELLVRQRAEAKIALQLRRQETLEIIVQKIRESLDIHEILATVTQQVKEVLHCDRVIVFRLFANGKSQIVEEAISEGLPRLKDQHWENETWSQEILDYYWQGKPRIVCDVMQDIWTKCLVEYSQTGQIQSKIVAPILQEVRDSEDHRWVTPWANNKLWGVLVVHACQEKRVWKDSEAQVLQQIANQLAIAIQQASLFQQLQLELAERQQAEAKLTESNQKLAISNEELARATRLKDEFLANMSHELRTPLNAILGMTEGLQEEVFGIINEQQLKALQTIERSGSHLLELINDILDLSKIEAGQIKLDYLWTSVNHLCQSSLAFIKQQALRKQIQVELKLPMNLPEILVDERRIRQVLLNLLNNAVKFTPDGGRITLAVTQISSPISTSDATMQHFLHFAIQDTGIGISPENIQKLFQPFVQIDSALNRQYTGTGLGLALVKQIVELHGGRVGLTSELGVGSCFTVDLPCHPSADLAPELITNYQVINTPEACCCNTNESPSLTPLILLVEDNEANISTVSSYLEAKGYRIVLANNGQEAIDLTIAHRPDLILMDIQMPGIDGLEAIRQIRQNPEFVNTPIIALTALAMSGDRDRCLAAGANDYLCKPVKLKQLATLIKKFFTDEEVI